MSRTVFASLLAVSYAAVLGTTSSAKALVVRISPVPERVALADVVVLGKVTAIEDKTVSAPPYPGAPQKVEFQVAVVKIEEGLIGTKGLTHVKVGFIAPMADSGAGRPVPIRPGRGFGSPKLTVGQEGCFFLTEYPGQSFYVASNFDSVINKQGNPNFEKEIIQAKQAAKLLADPMAGLKAKEAQDRALTAALLVVRYTTPRQGQTQREAIDAEESKLILQGLAEGDWTKGFAPDQLTPQMVFGRLGLSQKDGWNPGPFRNYQVEFPAAAKAWLKANAASYRIQRFVSEKKDK